MRCPKCKYNYTEAVPASCYVCAAIERRSFGDFVACFALALLGGFSPTLGAKPEDPSRLRWWRR